MYDKKEYLPTMSAPSSAFAQSQDYVSTCSVPLRILSHTTNIYLQAALTSDALRWSKSGY